MILGLVMIWTLLPGRIRPTAASGRESQLSSELVLMQHLFADDRYSPQARPVLSSDQALNVSFKFLLGRIEGLDEKTQVLTSFGWLSVSWTDQFLKWDPEQFQSTKKLVVDTYNIWMPEVVVMNNVVEGNDISLSVRFRASIHHTGLVVWAPGFKFETACPVDLTFFPFDQQTCWIKVISWSFCRSSVNFTMARDTEDDMLRLYQPSAEWMVVRTHSLRGNVAKDFPDGVAGVNTESQAPVVAFGFTIRRRPNFYLLNIMVPSTVMTMASMLVFILPCDAGEKVSLAISVLLSYSVLLLYVSGSMPKNSEAIPLLSLYLTIGMGLTTLSLLFTVCTINVHYRSPYTPVPRILSLVVLKWLGKIMCLPYKKKHRRVDAKLARTRSLSHRPSQRGGQYSSADYMAISRSSRRRCKSSASEEGAPEVGGQHRPVRMPSFNVTITDDVLEADVPEDADMELGDLEANDWRRVAAILDRFFLVTYTGTVVIVFVAMMMAVSQNTAGTSAKELHSTAASSG